MSKRVPTPQRQLTTVTDNRGGPRKAPARPHQASNQPRAGSIITVRVPLSTYQRGARKLVVTPPSAPGWAHHRTRIDDTLIKAIARAHRWNRMLERGEYGSITELAQAEGVTESYLARILRLTLLAPKIVETILDGRLNAAPQLQQLIKPFPAIWEEQETTFGTQH